MSDVLNAILASIVEIGADVDSMKTDLEAIKVKLANAGNDSGLTASEATDVANRLGAVVTAADALKTALDEAAATAPASGETPVEPPSGD